MHQQGGTIAEAMDSIASHKYVLPAIQREFVWQPDQVCNLFDSLMQGYPFGEFMFWQIEPENSADYRWYDFVREYHQRDNPHCPPLAPIQDKALTAVLDGQQRLTAFNIGLRGSMTLKLPNKWWNNPQAFPRRVLAIDLLATNEPDEEGRRYTFEFIAETRIGREEEHLWFKVGEVLGIEGGPAMLNWLMAKGLNGDQLTRAFDTLDRLHRAIRVDQVVAFYIEKSQDIERVLNIFIRCNSGGTQLSYSNLLLSIAVSQWETRDAREEVYRLVDEMNQIRVDLRFNADFVLKAGLMLTDIASVGFRVENFTQQNMAVLERNWEDIRQTLLETVVLVDSFGFDSRTIQATNSLLPIAYYLHQRAAPPGFATSDQYLDDRRAIRDWLTRSILKQAGIWGSGLDTLLTALRDVIRNAAGSRFPFAALCHTMAQRGKSLAFGEEEIEDLADIYMPKTGASSRCSPCCFQKCDRVTGLMLTMYFPAVASRPPSWRQPESWARRWKSSGTKANASPISSCWTGRSTTRNELHCQRTGSMFIVPRSRPA